MAAKKKTTSNTQPPKPKSTGQAKTVPVYTVSYKKGKATKPVLSDRLTDAAAREFALKNDPYAIRPRSNSIASITIGAEANPQIRYRPTGTGLKKKGTMAGKAKKK